MNQSSVARGDQPKISPNPQEKHRKVARPASEQEKHNQRFSGVLGEVVCLGGGNGGGSRRKKRGDKLFTYLTYSTVIKAYASNEVTVRLQPIVGKYRDTSENKDNKFKAIALENGVTLNGQRCILEAKEDTKKIENSKKAGWGELPRPKKFTKTMRRMIRRTIAALEAKYGRKNARFITITLPGSIEAAIRMFAKKSGKFLNAFNRFLWRCVGEDFGNRVSCWEWQDRGALHLHLVVFSKNQEGLKKIDEKLRDWCYKYFLRLSKKTGVDMFERWYGGTWKDNPEVLRCDSEVIEKSAAAYMSKYMSKDDSKDASNFDEDKPIYFPSSWWARGIAAKKVYHERQIELERKRIDQ